MLIVLFILFIGLSVVFYKCYDDTLSSGWVGAIVGSVTGLIVTSIMLVVAIACVVNDSVIDDKIAMYEEENARIEANINIIVANYQSYESDTFKTIAGQNEESTMMFVSLYPELKSDALVQQQLNIYISNNQTIKTLKTQKIDVQIWRWWLYFGS